MRICSCLFVFVSFSYAVCAQSAFQPPRTPIIPVTDTVHGFILTDNYRWLEDKTDSNVVEWTKNQHDSAMAHIDRTCLPISGLKADIEATYDIDFSGVPFWRGKYLFQYIRKKGELQNKLYWVKKKKLKLVFDPLAIDKSGKTAISKTAFNQKGDRVAIGVQNKGNEIEDYYIIDIKTGKQLYEPIKGLSHFEWCADEKHAYISIRTQEVIDKQLPVKWYWHELGTVRSQDVLVLAPDDAKDYGSVQDFPDDSLTFFTLGDFYSNKLMMRKVGSTEQPKVIYSSKQYAAFAKTKKGKIYFFTNDHAANYRVMVTDKNKPEYENWKVFYPEQSTVLNDCVFAKDNVFIHDKKDVLSRLICYDYSGNLIRQLTIPVMGNISRLDYHKEKDMLYVYLETFTHPIRVYALNCKTLKWNLHYEEPSPIDTKNIESKLVFYDSYDGKKVPMFILHKKGVQLTGNNPTLLWGYGGFNVGISPRYVGEKAAFINRGGIYAIAGLRGGNEYGEDWHKDGMLSNKQNVFDDYFAAAEYLIKENYTNPRKLAAEGRSNGGLLMGAILTQRPDLFKVALCGVPLLDMVRFHKFLIARLWIPEYGNPDVKKDLINILKYSPYHNIRMGYCLPTTLVYAGENDTRVDPLHAKKFVAGLQNNPSQLNPILLQMDFDLGHGAGASVSKKIENAEIRWRFIMRNLGM